MGLAVNIGDDGTDDVEGQIRAEGVQTELIPGFSKRIEYRDKS